MMETPTDTMSDDDSLFSREYKYFVVGFSISCEKFWKFMAGPRYFGLELELLICTDYYIIYAVLKGEEREVLGNSSTIPQGS